MWATRVAHLGSLLGRGGLGLQTTRLQEAEGQCEGIGRRRGPRRAQAGSMLAGEGLARSWGVGGVEVLSLPALLPVPPEAWGLL